MAHPPDELPELPEAPELLERLDALTIRDRHRLGRQLERVRQARRRGQEPELAELERAIERAAGRRLARARAVPALSYPDELPITARRDELRQAIAGHQVVVVAGETGSGKTTQLPKLCLELGRGVDGMIGHTQPRRIAARTVAERLAEELAVPLGGAVGYAVRFSDTVGDHTLVKVMTDGILLAEIRRDRQLLAYDTIIVDEAHERSLNIDFLLGYLTQLLLRRADLKVIVTSATIDTARFSAHFSAPVVEVSGRTYPVEVRYRPLDPAAATAAPADDAGEPGAGDGPGTGETADGPREGPRDPNQAICDAVAELVRDSSGDILVFLPGERDIRDAAEALRAAGPEGLEILPLYARLSAAEQHRVFEAHRRRRVVLATNIAETSLTVPGIRSVVDTGLARVSRFSHRTKVQRLPIEPISRASADQRAGRCGRVAPGICVRLYAEDDYASRPEFTDPEILRTNLASVILQMAVIGLGEIEAFPFLEAPDRRSVADGRALLEELGAFERKDDGLRLTPTGRQLAELPLDPRLGRMVLEAERRGCLREVTVIAAALSIQDPRERPIEHAQAADELHRRFAVPDSDFLAFVRLWDHLAGLQTELSGNQFRRRCRAEFLNVLRIREWQDVAGQVRQAYRSKGVHANTEPADDEQVHRALLSGLLSQIGRRDRVRGDYEGARSTRWLVGRASSLYRRQPAWAMAAALVETERTWARTVARIEPSWAEQLGAHLVKRGYGEPWWDPGRGEAMTEERVSLYGLPIVGNRRISLARIDPAAARELFIRQALVERDWPVELDLFARAEARLAEVRALEERARRRQLLADDERLFDFYDRRVPAEVTNGRRFERWWRHAEAEDPGLLELPLAVLVDPKAGPIDPADYPDEWVQGDLRLPLRYRWEPGSEEDGATVEVPLAVLNRLRPDGFDWGVPGWRGELVTALIRTLPKALRRQLVPAAEVARAVLESAAPSAGAGTLAEVVAKRLSSIAGEPISADDLDLDALPSYLRMRFEVLDEDGRVRGQGRDLDELRRRLEPEVRAAIAAAGAGLERHGATRWEFGDLPRQVVRGPVLAYPALVDEGDSVGVVLVESPRTQAEQMWSGTRRLLLLAAPLPTAHVQRRLTNEAKLAIARSGVRIADLLADGAQAVADQIIAERGGPCFDAAGFAELAATARNELAERVARLVSVAGSLLAAAGRVEERLEALGRAGRGEALEPALDDVRHQVEALLPAGFVGVVGEARLADLGRYLAAIERRLAALPGDLRRDQQRQATIGRLQARYDELAEELLSGAPRPGLRAELWALRWMLEELRVSLWAQSLGTPEPVSEARLARAMGRLSGARTSA